MLLTGVKDLDFKILNELDDVDLVNVCQTNKEADAICNNQEFWRNRIMVKFPYLSFDILNKYKGGRTWSKYYIKDLIKINNRSNVQQYLVNGAIRGRLDHVIIALNNGADIHNENNGVSMASQFGYLDIVRYLVENGANIPNTAVRWANHKGHFEVVKYLVENGADITTTVVFASAYGDLSMVKYAVEKGDDIHVENDIAVKTANENGHMDVVDYLVLQGAPDPRI